MALVIRAIAALLAVGLLTVGLLSAQAQTGPTAQLVITTRMGNGSTLLSTNPTVTVIATGPSLTGTPSSSGTLTYAGNFNTETKVITMFPSNYSVSVAPVNGYIYTFSSGCFGTAFAGEVKNCTITASQAGSARVVVFKNVINNSGGTKSASDFLIAVSGSGVFPSSFQGSAGGTTVTLNPGSYSIDEVSSSGYNKSRSEGCAGTIVAGETRTCILTNDDISSIVPAPVRLTCEPPRQAIRAGDTVTFVARGGTGSYNWATADRTYLNVGASLSVLLQTVGTQTVIVTSGSETAVCIVDTYSAGTPPYQLIPGGQVHGTSTYAPGLPNTGFGPNPMGLMLSLMTGIAMAGFLLFYGRKALVYIWE